MKPLGLTIDQVFWWVKSYLTDEAIALVQQAGVRGAALIAQTLGAVGDAQTMIGVVDEVRKVQANPDNDRTIPEGFYHPRARRPVNELLSALVEAAAAAQAAGSSGVFNAKTELETRKPGDTVNIDKLILIEQ